MHRIPMLVCTLIITLLPILGSARTDHRAQATVADPSPDLAVWTQRPDPIFSGQFIASDPTVVIDPDTGAYRMAYTCYDLDTTALFDPATTHAAICLATSPDGIAWTEIPTWGAPSGQIDGLAVRGTPGTWAENLEGSVLLPMPDGSELLYFSGYQQEGDPAMGFPAALAVARSSADDNDTFTWVSPDPILSPTPGGPDNDAIYSPAIVPHDGGHVMVYAAHCYTRCNDGPGVRILGATSPDGIDWTKRDVPVLESLPDLPWTRDGVAEPALLPGPDGRWYLFFTALRDADRVIGVACGDSPFGPWEIAPEPILTPGPGDGFAAAGVLAPDVHIDGDTARMWYLGVSPEESFAIGHAEAAWPFWP